MKFADYFQDAIKYGESLGLQLGRFTDDWVEIDEWIGIDDLEVTPIVYAVCNEGISANAFSLQTEQQVKLLKLFVTAYEKYLTDKKEPVAADSNR